MHLKFFSPYLQISTFSKTNVCVIMLSSTRRPSLTVYFQYHPALDIGQ